MSVLIKDMEMPTSCAFCRFNGAYCYAKGDEDAHSTAPCPLVAIPPHGRTIDVDKLIENAPAFRKAHIDALADEWYVRLRDIEDAPTIIEAEDDA